MQLGFVTAIFPELNLAEVVEFAAHNDYDTIEVMCWPSGGEKRRYAGVSHLDISEFDDHKAEVVTNLLNEYGINISALGYYPNPLTPNLEEAEVIINHLKALIEVSAKLEIHKVNSFIGRDWNKSVEDNWTRFLEVWKPIIKHAEEFDVKVGIENCPMLFTKDEWPGGKNLATSPAIWERMFEDIPSDHFGLNFDPSHFIWQQMDYLSAIREFSDKFFHVHAKDVRMDYYKLAETGILAYPNDYHTPKLPGLGDVDWGGFFSELTCAGYDGPVCVEVEDRAFEETLDLRKRSLVQSAGFLRQYIPPVE